ncbi:RNA exonuclease 3, partial [Dictyocoela muelleri]
KIKLKELARKYLKKQIQVNEHCSIEDALTSLELLSIKVKELESLKKSNEEFDINVLIRKDVDYRKIDFKERAINTFFTEKFPVDVKKYPNSIFITFFKHDGEIHYSFL